MHSFMTKRKSCHKSVKRWFLSEMKNKLIIKMHSPQFAKFYCAEGGHCIKILRLAVLLRRFNSCY